MVVGFIPISAFFLLNSLNLAPNTTILSTSNGLGGHLGLPFLLQVQQFAKATPPGSVPAGGSRYCPRLPSADGDLGPEQRSAFLLKAARRLGRWGPGGCCMDGVKLVKHGETGETENEI